MEETMNHAIFDVVSKDDPTALVGRLLGRVVEDEDVWCFHQLLSDGRLHHEDDFDDLETAIQVLNRGFGPLELIQNTSEHMVVGEPIMAFEAAGPELAMRFADTCVHVVAKVSEAGTPYLAFSRSVPKGPPPPPGGLMGEDGITAEDAGVLSLLSYIF
jgi:hypothetical protein